MAHQPTYDALKQTTISPNGCYLMDAFNPSAVTADSPATLAMTDLSRVPPATISSDVSLEEANHSMIMRGVRLLPVVTDNRVIGLITSADILGERPFQIAQNMQTTPRELRVTDVMVPVDQVEALSIETVRKATVGQIVATLKADRRAHALVFGHDQQNKQVLVGIFSASQIARQLGVQVQVHEMARTFAEMEAVIAAA
jgi:signal-transduction protein with cAMP-binding, CBS, and nucleotidyltransferase domain